MSGPPPIELDDAGRIAQDLVCRSCGYSLRGLATNGRCPECAEAIGRSIHGDLLRFSDPNWVERIARGVRWLVICFIVSLVGGVALGLLVAVLLGAFGMGSAGFMVVIFVVFLLGVSIFNILGYWMATTPDPSVDESQQPLTARAIARWSIVGQALFGLAALPFEGATVLSTTTAASPSVELALSTLLSGASQALGVVGMVAMLAYARKLARRIPDDGIARHCRIVMIGYAIGGSIMLLGTLCTISANSDPTHPMTLAANICNVVGGIPVLVFGIWALVLLFRFRSRLRTAARQARETWARMAV